MRKDIELGVAKTMAAESDIWGSEPKIDWRNVRLIGDKILVELEDPMKERDLGGGIKIFYPSGSHGDMSEINVEGKVLSVGPGPWATKRGKETDKHVPMEIKPGDRIMIVYYLSKVETQLGVQRLLGPNRIIVRPSDVLGIIDEA
jgi:co-chaperonin GroES (HSP10)